MNRSRVCAAARACIVLALATLTACSQMAPVRSIPATPEFIMTGVQVGDEVTVVKKSGDKLVIKVQKVTATTIHGSGEEVSIAEIRRVTKRSWTVPANPCGGGQPVGCSIPAAVTILSDFADEMSDRIHPACVVHDYCYRHGFATYGVTKQQCDDDFLQNMKKECRGPAGLNILDVKEYAACELAADQIYAAVQRNGTPFFRTSTSTKCEYRLLEQQ